MLTEWEDKWLLEEYKLLSTHYFHEDQTYFRIGGLLITFNGAFIALSATSSEVVKIPLGILVLFSCFGLGLTLAWTVMLWRIRAYRLAHTDRIEEIEKIIESHWTTTSMPSPQIRLRIAQRIAAIPGSAPSRWARNIPASIVFLLVPMASAAYWLTLPFWRH
jgi:hypothetical protein